MSAPVLHGKEVIFPFEQGQSENQRTGQIG